jgi:hypothetical protein
MRNSNFVFFAKVRVFHVYFTTATNDRLMWYNTAMSENRLSPTPAQRLLVNIGMIIQFHLAAIGHLVAWWQTLHSFQNPKIPDGWTYEQWYMEGGFITETVVFTGIPISLGILIAMYILFRCLLAYAGFEIALPIMISISFLQAIAIGFIFYPTAARLAIPIVLYSIACYRYHVMQVKHAIQLQETEDVETDLQDRK